MRLRNTTKDTLICAGLCLVTALVSFVPFIVADGGALTLRADFDLQQVPFTMALHNQIARGGLVGWCWNLDLGASAIQGFGFYELGSPFFWATMVFPATWFPYIVGWMYVVKYVVAGVSAFVYMRRFVKQPSSAMVGALLYAFSGFQTTNLLFYHFHDVVALFPFLLIGLERLMASKDDWKVFSVAVCANCLVNYVFFVQSVVFLLLYFGFRFGPVLWKSGPQTLARAVARCFAFGILGTGMAAVLLVPSAFYMSTNSRAAASSDYLTSPLWPVGKLLTIVQAFLFPGDAMHSHNALYPDDYLSTACWMPMVGMVLVLAYVRKRRDWLAGLFGLLVVFSLFPHLNAAFLLFASVYQRWWYVLVMVMALMSAKVLDEIDAYDLRLDAAICLAVTILFSAGLTRFTMAGGEPAIKHADRFVLYLAVAVAGILATALLCSSRVRTRLATHARTNPAAIFLATVMLFGAGSTAMTMHYYRAEWDGDKTHALTEVGTQLQVLDPQYRYATSDNRLTLTGEAAGTNAFSSTISTGSARLEALFDSDPTDVWHLRKESVPGLSELLGGAYTVRDKQSKHELVDTIEARGTTYYVQERDACPIGFVCDSYMSVGEVADLPLKKRALALMQAAAVQPSDADKISASAQKTSTDKLDLDASVSELAQSAQARGVREFRRDDHGFSCSVDADKRALVYFSVPNDAGWTVSVDGTPTDIVDSAGMMLVPVEAGSHRIEARYHTPGLNLGMGISAVCWLVFAGGFVRSRRDAKRLV